MILVDTSVWVDHLRADEPKLVNRLKTNEVLIHTAIIGEIACGSLSNRTDRLKDLQALPHIPELANGDVINLIESKKLMGRGIGLVDVHIFGSVLNSSGSMLWTRDKRLHAIADEFGIAFFE